MPQKKQYKQSTNDKYPEWDAPKYDSWLNLNIRVVTATKIIDKVFLLNRIKIAKSKYVKISAEIDQLGVLKVYSLKKVWTKKIFDINEKVSFWLKAWLLASRP